MKKILLISIILIILCLFVGTVSASSNGLENGYGIDGTKTNAGSQSNPYAINDFADLNAISTLNSGSSVYYKQTQNIVLSDNKKDRNNLGNYDGSGYELDGRNLYSVGLGTNLIMRNCYYKNIITSTYGAIYGSHYNCMFENCHAGTSQISSVDEGGLIYYRGVTDGTLTIENCIFKQCSVWASSSGSRKNAIVIGYVTGVGTVSSSVKNCVVISCDVLGSQTAYRVSGSSPVINSYASSDSTPIVSSTDANSLNGATITSTQYNSNSWWQNTAGYDFSSSGAWVWDSVTNLPKLRHTIPPPTINSVSVTSPTPAFYTTPITASVSASSVVAGVTYQWFVSTNGGGWSAISGATSATLTYTPTTAGTYTFCVTATNSAGSTNSWDAGFRSVTAKALTNPTFTQQPAFSAAQGTLTAQPSISFVANANYLGDTSVNIHCEYIEVAGTGGTWQAATTNTYIDGIWTIVKPIHYSDTVGTEHTYTVMINTFVGSSWSDPNKRIIGEVTSEPFSFRTYAAPVFTSVSIYPTTAAVPATITFSATATDATSIIYQLSSNDITWSQITSPYTINQVGTYYFRAVASGYGGQTYSDTQTITVSDLAPVIESAAASPTSGLVPFSVTFTASATNNPTYTWYQRVNGLDRQIGTGTPFVYQFGSGLAAGVYKFRVKAHNEYGDTYSPDISVTVGALPGTIITGPSAGSSFMQRQTITFTASSSSQFDTSYSWSFSDGGTASGASVYHSFQNIGEASATVTGTNQFGSDSATIRLQILEYSSVSVSVSDISAVGATFTGLIAESSIDPTTKMHFEIMSKSGTVLWKTDEKLYSQSNTFTAEGMPLISGQVYKVRAVTDKYGNSIDVSFTLNEASRNAPDKLGTVYESSGLNRDPFNVTKLVDGSTDVLGSALGGGTVGKAIAFGVIVLFLVVGLWLRQGDVIIPVTIGLAGGWFIIGNLPGEWQPVAYTILVVSIVAIFWVIFKKRVE